MSFDLPFNLRFKIFSLLMLENGRLPTIIIVMKKKYQIGSLREPTSCASFLMTSRACAQDFAPVFFTCALFAFFAAQPLELFLAVIGTNRQYLKSILVTDTCHSDAHPRASRLLASAPNLSLVYWAVTRHNRTNRLGADAIFKVIRPWLIATGGVGYGQQIAMRIIKPWTGRSLGNHAEGVDWDRVMWRLAWLAEPLRSVPSFEPGTGRWFVSGAMMRRLGW